MRPNFGSSAARLGSFLVLVMAMVTGCDRTSKEALQGYVEGEFVYVASPLAGSLESLSVRRGGWVKLGEPLFALEHGAESAARTQAVYRLEQGRAILDDSRKGKRVPEVAVIEAQLKASRAALALAESDYTRELKLSPSGASSAFNLDRARSTRDQEFQREIQLESELQVASLGQRVDQVVAAEANVKALEAVLARADWDLAQKQQKAPSEGLVHDTLYREGEWVAAGRPVVALLPPTNIKVRTFVPEQLVGKLQPGAAARVHVDGVAESMSGKISFISPKAEYTPPVIYSRESRSKLVFMVEIVFEPSIAARLHPGQPVDVELEP